MIYLNNPIKLPSVTAAMQARDFLREKGIKAVVTRIPAKKAGEGCSYGLDIKNRRDEAVLFLNERYGRALGGGYDIS